MTETIDTDNMDTSNIKTDSKQTARNGNGLLFTLLISIIILCAGMGAGGYYAWQFSQQSKTQLTELQKNIDAQKTQQQHTLQQLQKSQQQIGDKQINEQQKLKIEVHSLLNEQNQKIQSIKQADRSDWLLSESAYLLRLANQQAMLSHDAKSAEALLGSADTILKDLNDAYFSEVRRVISEERSALSLQPGLDQEGLYFRIAAIAKQIQSIPVIDLQQVGKKQPKEKIDADDKINETRWQQWLTSLYTMLDNLGGLIRIQQHDNAIGPLISPQEQQYLKLNLRFMLEQSQLALLQKKQILYTDSLEKSAQWLEQYFVMNAKQKTSLLTEINSLSSINIEQTLPDISQSSSILKRLMKTRRLAVKSKKEAKKIMPDTSEVDSK